MSGACRPTVKVDGDWPRSNDDKRHHKNSPYCTTGVLYKFSEAIRSKRNNFPFVLLFADVTKTAWVGKTNINQ